MAGARRPSPGLHGILRTLLEEDTEEAEATAGEGGDHGGGEITIGDNHFRNLALLPHP